MPTIKSNSEQKYREGYMDAQLEQRRNTSNATGGIVIGIVIVALLGVGGWILFGQGLVRENESPQSTTENTDINIDLPTPEIEVPDVDLPDVKVSVPQPDTGNSSDDVSNQSPE